MCSFLLYGNIILGIQPKDDNNAKHLVITLKVKPSLLHQFTRKYLWEIVFIETFLC